MRIQELEINEIRGIRRIHLEPKGENIVVFGPNGVGKSAIVDAIDFLLTGKIKKLTGEGTKCLGLKEHGCHVDSRANLKNTSVIAKVKIDGKEIKIQRSINNPSVLKVEPNEYEELVESKLKVAELGQHILSRKEILRYIVSEGGKRAKEIMSLLDLSNIENIRSVFVTVKNNSDAEYKNAESNLEVAKEEIKTLLSLSTLSKKDYLDKVNNLRESLNGLKITELTPELIKKDLKPHLINAKEEILTKEQIENTIKFLKNIIKGKDELISKEKEIKNLLEEIIKEVELKQYSLYKKLFEAGINLIGDSNICPLCDQEWSKGNLKDYIIKKDKKKEVAKEKQEKINEISTFLKNKIDLIKNAINNLLKAHEQFKIKDVDVKTLEKFIFSLELWSKVMLNPLESFENDKWPKSNFNEIFDLTYLEEALIIPIEYKIKEVGDTLSQKQKAWDILTKLEDKWKTYLDAHNKKDSCLRFKKRAENSLDYFEKARDSILESIYAGVNKNFGEYYKSIHMEDEGKFTSKISAEKSELNLEVDFYGRGLFPPHALHSEGHQDSMGICLFFALNKFLTKNILKIIVLDDVVMSIDNTHRREVCNLLKKFFSDTQFIITTHETAWAKQLKAEGIVKKENMIHFVNWNINTGPIFELGKDLWDKIEEDLARDDVPAAAHKLRRNAESFFEDVCDLLGAKITYKGNHRWELGDFAPAAISIYRGYIRKALNNFKKLGIPEKIKELEELDEKTKKIIAKSQIEQWIINDNVHFNKWDEFNKEDFEPVVKSFKDLFALFTCSKCGGLLAVTSSKGETPKTTVSCNCGKICWNF